MKYAVVTGGTSGMGLGVAKMLLSKGYYVFATYVGSDFTEKIENFEALKIDQTNRTEVYVCTAMRVYLFVSLSRSTRIKIGMR